MRRARSPESAPSDSREASRPPIRMVPVVGRPDIVLADEPTGNLDSGSGREVLALLRQLNAEDGTTIAVITHDRDLAASLPRQVHLLDGRIEHDSAWSA